MVGNGRQFDFHYRSLSIIFSDFGIFRWRFSFTQMLEFVVPPRRKYLKEFRIYSIFQYYLLRKVQ